MSIQRSCGICKGTGKLIKIVRGRKVIEDCWHCRGKGVLTNPAGYDRMKK